MSWPGSRADEMVSTETEGRRRRWPFWVAGVVVLVAAGTGLYLWRQYRELTSSKYSVINYSVPSSPHLVAGDGETVYRIDPTRSALTYSVEEKLFGQDASEASGTTNGIAGDLAINAADPGASRVGQIVVNVEQLHSDNNLRDAQIRSGYLGSHEYPLAYLTASGLTGMPADLTPGTPVHFKLQSQLTVRKTPAPVTWDVHATLDGDTLTATATADVKMSTFGIGPISIAGLVSTSDDVTLTMKLTAVDPSKVTVPNAIAAPPDAPRSGDSPSFKEVVMPALQANCASCHRAGAVGAAHWSLTTANDAAKIADGIGTVVEAKYMPPWPASDVGVPLNHSKQLDQKTLSAIVKWSRAGGPLDVPPSTPIKATRGPQGEPPRHDVVMKMPQAYTGSLTNPNDYRCFVLDPHITKPTFMTGYEVTPATPTEIHHAQIFHIDKSQVEASASVSGKDGKPGWSCYTGPSLPSSEARDRTVVKPNTPRPATRRRSFGGQPGLVAGWVPGQDPVIYSEHSGILLQPGDALVLQIHYHYDTTPKPDRSTVALQLDPGTDPIKRLEVVNPIGPVELPCMPGVSAPLCDRDAALKEAARLYGPSGSFIEPGLLGLCGKTAAELAATFKDGVAHSSCDTTVPFSGTIVGALGHMHTLGKTFRFTLDPDSPKPTVLLDIPVWNFDWQMNYELKHPLHVEAGQTIRMECSWDRRLDPNRPPKYIVFAEGTEDEMCFGTYSIIPDDQS
jgi:polyisoprenoid-binding protein YceI/mono/diheme cytochrome c family protein